MMAIGGWDWWLDRWASLDRTDELMALPADLFFTLKTSDGSAFYFTMTKSGDQLETSLIKWEGQPTLPASESVGGGRMDRYREMAAEQIGRAADRILGESLGTDLLRESPVVEQLALAMAAGRFGSLYGTAAPGSSESPGGGQAMSSGGEDPEYPNRAPVAEDDLFVFLGHNNPNQHVAFYEGPDGVLANDYDEDGDPIEPVLWTPPTHDVDPASFDVNSDGSFSYEPIDNYAGVDSFTYYVTDGDLSSELVTVEIALTNWPPEISGAPGDYTIVTGTSLFLVPPGLTPAVTPAAADTVDTGSMRDYVYEPDDDNYGFEITQPPGNGGLTFFDDIDNDSQPDGGFIYTPDTNYIGPDSFTYKAVDAVLSPDTGESLEVTVNIEVMPKFDLDVATILHNAPSGWLPDDPLLPYWDDPETLPGAFLPLNDDDDDYDAGRTPDYQQTGAIAGENDLVPIVLRPADPVTVGGIYYLNISGGVRVWENPDRTGEVHPWLDPNESSFDATVETTLYVEGVSEGGGSITLVWDNQPLGHNWFADTVNFKVFRWCGPLNVPDYSIHEYTAWGTYWTDSSGGVGGDGEWLPPVGGNVATIPGVTNPEDHWMSSEAQPDKIFIHWQGGPQIGKAVYQAHPDYVWDLDVNVVEIRVENPDSDPAWQSNPAMPEDGFTAIQAGTGIRLKVVRTEPALPIAPPPGVKWTAKVTLEGPDRGATDRGETEMRIGFVQIAALTLTRGTYLSGKSLVWDIEGNSYLDTHPASGCRPLYSDADFTTMDLTRESETNPKEILCWDSPAWGPPTNYECTYNGTDRLVSMELLWSFDTNVTARTTDTRNDASTIYTPRAVGSWEFDGTGDISVDEFGGLFWTQTGCGLVVPAGWTSVTDGKQVHTSPPLINEELALDAAHNGTWSDPGL